MCKSKALRVAYTSLMAEIWPASSAISLREMAESSLKIDPHNANPFIVLAYRRDIESPNSFCKAMAARILEIDPTSPYAPYLFSLISCYIFIGQ